MPRIERTADVVWEGNVARGTRRDHGGHGRVHRAPVLAPEPDRQPGGQDEPGGAARGGARGLPDDVARERADPGGHTADPPRRHLPDRHGRGGGRGAPDRRLTGDDSRRRRRRRRRRASPRRSSVPTRAAPSRRCCARQASPSRSAASSLAAVGAGERTGIDRRGDDRAVRAGISRSISRRGAFRP